MKGSSRVSGTARAVGPALNQPRADDMCETAPIPNLFRRVKRTRDPGPARLALILSRLSFNLVA